MSHRQDHSRSPTVFKSGLTRHALPLIALVVGIGVLCTLTLGPWLAGKDSVHLHIAFAMGFIVTAVLAFILGFVLARTAKIENLVTQRTIALADANAALKKEIQHRGDAEEKLRQQTREMADKNEHYQLVVKHSGQIIYDLQPAKGLYTRLGNVESILGFREEEFNAIDSASWANMIHPDDRPTVAPQLENALSQPANFTLTYRLRRKDGSYAHVFDRGVSLGDETGCVRRVVGIVTDTSALKQLQDSSREQVRFLEALLNAIPSPVFYKDSAGVYRGGNKAFAEQILGLPLERVVGRTLRELPEVVPPPLAALYTRRDEELMKQGGQQIYEAPVRCSDGVEREFLFSKAVFVSEKGEPQGIIGCMADISERKRFELALETSQHRLAEAMAVAELAHWEHDPIKGIFTFNERFYSLHGTTTEREGGYQMPTDVYVREFLFPEDAHIIDEGFAQAVASRELRCLRHAEHRIKRRDGRVGHVAVSIEITKDPDGRIIRVSGTTQDVTARRKAEDELTKLWPAVEQSPTIVVITDANGIIEYVNQRFVETTGYTATEVLGRNPRILKSGQHPQEFYTRMWQTIRSGERWRGEIRNRKKDGTLYWESVLIAPVKNQAGKTTHFIAVKEDITSRKQVAEELKRTEEALKQREAFLRTVTEAAPLSFYVSDSRTDSILYFNQHFCTIWGLEGLQDRLRRGEVRHSELFPYLLARVADRTAFTKHCEPVGDVENRAVIEADIALVDGRILHHFSTQIRDEKDAFLGRLCLLEDVTKRKQSEQQLASSLQQKEILLREVYHRVKNNLQVISSLLNLQTSAINDPQTIRLIRETQDRIRSMALVHEKLYRAKDLSRIDFDEYTRQLATMLARSYRTQTSGVNLRFSLESICLNLETAIPCGLILNELVSNALKHAFPPAAIDPPPELNIGLHSVGNDRYTLVVADNGVGLPSHVDVHNTASLGLQVVCMLTEQLRGKLEVECNHGTRFTITFSQINGSLGNDAHDRALAEAENSGPAKPGTQ